MGTEELTPREFDVLEQIVRGKSNKEIATETGHLGGHGEDAYQQPAGQAGRDRPDAGGHGGNSTWHCSSRIAQEAERMSPLKQMPLARFIVLRLGPPPALPPRAFAAYGVAVGYRCGTGFAAANTRRSGTGTY